ncbi:hypothetical protein H70357_24765 [Paenibacillus sp. FSL H7-0357]|uniref:BC1872 family protein n=1 Tax=Paenibacillus sp. FSL H7-0357 TaxID=1536774 RepID=UPI0004F588CC|nr:hypothetical protein [Paenibacillus sp. FSL H7-0357]AIQ19562.1 hypothetical protein H70357_24765 [Paenibacillus sp. FSL H7-0357]
MTREEIMAMEPGKKLDHIVIETVLKWHKVELTPKGNGWFWSDGNTHVGWAVFSPSVDISAAWEVVEHINKRESHGLALEFYPNEQEWGADFDELGLSSQAVSKTAPEAICKAALFAVLNL